MEWIKDTISNTKFKEQLHKVQVDNIKTRNLVNHLEDVFKTILKDNSNEVRDLKTEIIKLNHIRKLNLEDLRSLNHRLHKLEEQDQLTIKLLEPENLEQIQKRILKLEANEGDLLEIKQELNEIYERLGRLEVERERRE